MRCGRSRALPRKKRRQPFTVKMDPQMNGYWGDNTYQTMAHQSALLGTPSIQLEIPYTMRQVKPGWCVLVCRRWHWDFGVSPSSRNAAKSIRGFSGFSHQRLQVCRETLENKARDPRLMVFT